MTDEEYAIVAEAYGATFHRTDSENDANCGRVAGENISLGSFERAEVER